VIENWVEINEEKIRKQVDIYKNVRKSLDLTVNKKIVLFFWSFEYKPNIEALEIINTEIIPNSNNEILFMVIWKWIENFSTKNTNIKYIGYVPNIEDYIIWSDLVIAPLISGGWTKLKIIESLWYWKKVITTEIWWEWIEKWDSNLIIRNDWKTFGEAINENIVRNSPCTQNPKYSWTNKERELLSIINECRSKLL
jgi:glycosyltransferase involved in cell wall biosynthesis